MWKREEVGERDARDMVMDARSESGEQTERKERPSNHPKRKE